MFGGMGGMGGMGDEFSNMLQMAVKMKSAQMETSASYLTRVSSSYETAGEGSSLVSARSRQ